MLLAPSVEGLDRLCARVSCCSVFSPPSLPLSLPLSSLALSLSLSSSLPLSMAMGYIALSSYNALSSYIAELHCRLVIHYNATIHGMGI